MRVSVWVPDLIVRGSIGPGVVWGLLEMPFIVGLFSGIDPTQIWTFGYEGGYVIADLIVAVLTLSFLIGFVLKEPRRALQIFIVSQVFAFAFSLIPLFIFPGLVQGLSVQEQCVLGCEYLDQTISSFFMLFAGVAFIVLLVGFATSSLGAFIGEFRSEARD